MLGAVVGTLLDGIHAYGDVLAYDVPGFGRWGWFVPLEFALLGVAAALAVPTRIVGADPAVHSIFTGDLAAEVLQNPVITLEVVAGAGHSPHRDRPEAAIAALLAALA